MPPPAPCHPSSTRPSPGQPWPPRHCSLTLPCAALTCLHMGKGERRAEAACLSSLVLEGVKGGAMHTCPLVLSPSQEE